jgi:hypothetical protein
VPGVDATKSVKVVRREEPTAVLAGNVKSTKLIPQVSCVRRE